MCSLFLLIKSLQTKNEDLSKLKYIYDTQSPSQLLNHFSLNLFRRDLNYSQLEFYYYIGLQESEDKIDLVVNTLLQKIVTRLQLSNVPVRLEQIIYFLLSFCSDYVVYHIIVYIFENLLPEYAKEYLTNSEVIVSESEAWNSVKYVLIQICRDAFKSNEAEIKSINMFIQNEGRDMLSTMMIKDVSVQCFHYMFEEMMSTLKFTFYQDILQQQIKFEDWEKYFLAMIKLNLNTIKDPKAETNINILRNTKIHELKKIKKDYESHLSDISQKIIQRRNIMSQNNEANQLQKLQEEYLKAKEQLENKDKEIIELKRKNTKTQSQNEIEQSEELSVELKAQIQKDNLNQNQQLSDIYQNNQNSELKNQKQIEEFKSSEESLKKEVYHLQEIQNEKINNEIIQKQKQSEWEQNELKLKQQFEEQISKLSSDYYSNKQELIKNHKDEISKERQSHAEIIQQKQSEQEQNLLKLKKQLEEQIQKISLDQVTKEQEILKIHQEELLTQRLEQSNQVKQQQSEWEQKEFNLKKQLEEQIKRISSNGNDLTIQINKNTELEQNIIELESKLKQQQENNQQKEYQIKQVQQTLFDYEQDSEKKQQLLNNRIQELMQEISSFNQQIQSYQQQFKEFEIKIEKFKNNEDDLKQQLIEGQQKLKDKENIILINEQSQIEKDLNNKDEQIQQMYKKHDEDLLSIKKQYEEEKQQIYKQHNEDLSENKNQTVQKDELIQKLQQNIIQFQQQIKENEEHRKKLDEENKKIHYQIETCQIENKQSLDSMIKNNEQSIQQFQAEITEQNNQILQDNKIKYQQEIDQLNLQFQKAVKENLELTNNLQDQLSTKDKIIDHLNISFNNEQEEKKVFQQKVSLLENNNQHLEIQLTQKLQELQQIQQLNNTCQSENKEQMDKLKLDNQQIKNDLELKVNELQQIKYTFKQSESQIEELKKRLTQSQQELDNLEKQWTEKETIYKSKQQEFEQNIKQKELAIITFKEVQNENQSFTEEKMKDYAKKYEQEQKLKSVQIQQDIIVKNQFIEKKEQQLIAQFVTIQCNENEIKKLQQQIEVIEKEKNESQEKIQVLENEINATQSENQKQAKDNNKQQEIVSSIQEKLNESQNLCSEYEQQLKALRYNQFSPNNQEGFTQSATNDDEIDNKAMNTRQSRSHSEINFSNSFNKNSTNIPRLNMSDVVSSGQSTNSSTTKIIELQIQVKSLENKNSELKENLKTFKEIGKINTNMQKLLDENRVMIKDLQNQIQQKDVEIQQKNVEIEQMKKDIKVMKIQLTEFEVFEQKFLEMNSIEISSFKQISDKIKDIKQESKTKQEMANIIESFAKYFKTQLEEREEKLNQYYRKLEQTVKEFNIIQEQNEEMEQLLLEKRIDISHIIKTQNKPKNNNIIKSPNKNQSKLQKKYLSTDIEEELVQHRTRDQYDLRTDRNTTCIGGDCRIF